MVLGFGTMNEVELEDAIAHMERNRASRWPGRGAANRLEPECWPEMNPRFHLHPGSTVFTIGSCFARGVEKHLAAMGFDIPMRRYLEENTGLPVHGDYELVTKYTPASIYQELNWTKRIRDRDGIVTDEDIEPFLLDIGNGKFTDLQRSFQGEFGAAREDLLALRRTLYGLFEKAFDCDVVIITLGLIECWLDRKTGQYVEFSDHLRKCNDGGRFAFKRLSFQEAYDFAKRTVDLIGANGKVNVLLTASPVPMMRTFTGDDVIVANMHSKSVLRAVAGQIAEEYPNVDYLPGYETVMLTKQAAIWSGDLRHIEPDFVGRIMSNLCGRYLAETDSRPEMALYAQRLRFTGLVKQGRFDDAREILDLLPRDGLTHGAGPQYVLALAKLYLHSGQQDKALAIISQLRDGAAKFGEEACVVLLGCASIFEALGDADALAGARALAFEKLRDPMLVKSLIRRSVTSGELDTTRQLIDHVEHRLAENIDLLNFAAQTCYAIEDFDSAERICRTALESQPQNAEMLARLGYVLSRRERSEEAVAVLERALTQSPTNTRILETLIPIQMKLKRLDQAERCARMLIAASPLNPAAHSFLASALKRSGRPQEALPAARRAAELDPHNDRYRRYADDLAASVADNGDSARLKWKRF
jgi:tetratricopeptide (TPR) repeat protein